MPICRYFQQGKCRFGAACKYEHRLEEKRTPGGRTSFGGNGAGNNGGNGAGRNGGAAHDAESRLWPLTTYARENPATGNLLDEEMSPEELRAHAYATAHRGHSRDVVDRENVLVSDFRRKLAAIVPLHFQAQVSKEPSGMVMDQGQDYHQSNGGPSRNGTMPINDPFAPVAPAQVAQPFFQ